jgi:hypothetical protein
MVLFRKHSRAAQLAGACARSELGDPTAAARTDRPPPPDRSPAAAQLAGVRLVELGLGDQHGPIATCAVAAALARGAAGRARWAELAAGAPG